VSIEVRVLGPGDEQVLQRAAPDVFDHPVDFRLAAEFLRDGRHQVIRALLEAGRTAGCREAWVLTERTNVAAMRLYTSVGGTEGPDECVLYSFVLDP